VSTLDELGDSGNREGVEADVATSTLDLVKCVLDWIVVRVDGWDATYGCVVLCCVALCCNELC
jgi:hypothetical protein